MSDSTPSPAGTSPPIPLCPEGIPAALRGIPHWVGWRYERRGGKLTKPPLCVRRGKVGGLARVSQPETWATFPEAVRAWETGSLAGVGIVLTTDTGLVGVDLDHALDDAGNILPWAADILQRFADAYTEWSPSGTGFRLFLQGTLPESFGQGRKYGGLGEGSGALEVYGAGRYLTLTGAKLPLSPVDITEGGGELAALLEDYWPELVANTGEGAVQTVPCVSTVFPGSVALDDAALLEKMFSNWKNGVAIRALWDGDNSAHGGNDSVADLALASYLLWWCGGEPARAERLFSESPRGQREKWRARADYRQRTLAKALEGLTGGYSGSVSLPSLTHTGGGDATHWPDPPDKEAFHGLAGDFVRIVEPHSEADPVALLVQFLVAFGSAVGRGPHQRVEADRHGTNLFVCLVGNTASGRKGTSWGHVRRALELADSEWADARVFGGLSSGEGLIGALQRVRGPEGVNTTDAAGPVSPAPEDRRFLAVESEFARTLRAMARDGNTLSAILRNAWDGGNLQVMTKGDPLLVKRPHVSFIAHITPEELLRCLEKTETSNGFGNRFLWVAVRRSKLLPEGGQVPWEGGLRPLVEKLREVLSQAKERGELTRSEEAREVWREVYPELSAERPGLLGNMLARSPAQVTRLSGLYALLDGTATIAREHLLAALALWEYCENSARWVFGDSPGDAREGRLLAALRAAPEGMTRTEVSNVFGRHLPQAALDGLLGRLENTGGIVRVKRGTGGRAAEVWRLPGGGS